jgi:ABC-type Zn2+ transport system substrate-binding protein/surface adhesin
VQLDENYRQFANVEPFCTMFPQIEHLDIPIDHLDSCQYIIDRLGKYLISVVFRFPNNDNEDDDEDDDDEEDDAKHNELIEWAENIQQNHQYRIRDGDVYLWLE